MKLQRLPEYLLVAIVTLLGMGFAVYCGQLVGHGQSKTVWMFVIFALAMYIALKMGTRIWFLIPMTWPLLGEMQVLPLPFALRDVVILGVFALFLALKAFKRIRRKPTFDALDFVLAINLFYLLTVFARNPVGVLAIESERVGGKPYASACIACLAYWVLGRVTVEAATAKKLVLWMLTAPAIELVLGAITYYFPITAPTLGRIYTGGISMENYDTESGGAREEDGGGRRQFMSCGGAPLALALCSYFRPLTLINPEYILRFAAFGFSIYATISSGFRSSVMLVVAILLLSSFLRKGAIDLFRMAWFGGPLIFLLLLAQGHVLELPLVAQRSLSFLPAKWDPNALEDARGSTEWRVQMWKTVLTSDKYIRNKILGDGFGFSRRDLEMAARKNSEQFSAEAQMINGDFHSGPVSAIRNVGYVGLVLYEVLLVCLAFRAWKVARKAMDTPFFPVALYVGIPVIFEPLNYNFIFGGFSVSLPNSIYCVAMLKMIATSLDAHLAAPQVADTQKPILPAPRRTRPAPKPALPALARTSFRKA